MATKKVVPMKPDVETQLGALREDISKLAEAVKIQTKDLVSEKKDQAEAIVADKAGTVKSQYDEIANEARKSMREKPLTTIGIALGIGMLFGLTRR